MALMANADTMLDVTKGIQYHVLSDLCSGINKSMVHHHCAFTYLGMSGYVGSGCNEDGQLATVFQYLIIKPDAKRRILDESDRNDKLASVNIMGHFCIRPDNGIAQYFLADFRRDIQNATDGTPAAFGHFYDGLAMTTTAYQQ